MKEFLGLFPYLKTLFPRRSSTFISRNRNLRILALASVSSIIILSISFFFPYAKKNQATMAVTGTAKDSSITLNVSNATASVDLNVTSPDGTFASSSTNAEFSVVTNNFSGYTLSIIGSDSNGLLYDENNTNSLSSIISPASLESFASAEGGAYNGKWGYLPNKYNSAINTNYLPAPTNTADTLDVTTTKNDTANNYTIAIGARTDYTTPSANYSNTFTITAVTNPVEYAITYDANTNDTVSNMPGTQASSTSATSIILSSNTPVRAGYVFGGWCTVVPSLSNGIADCSGATYQPSAVYGIDKTTENITVLYAIWGLKNVGYMQDYNYDECRTEALIAPVLAIDGRNNKTYTIRFINDVCTMTQNLAVDMSEVLTPSDTNIVSNYTMTATDLAIGDNSYSAEMHEPTETELLVTGLTRESNGNYYNYAAATADTVTGPINGNAVDAVYDICPKGWRLPTGREGGEQDKINNYTAFQTWNPDYIPSSTTLKPFVPVGGGLYYSGTVQYPEYGQWWASTASNATQRNFQDYRPLLGLAYGGDTSRNVAHSIRCVASKPSTIITFNGNGGTASANNTGDNTKIAQRIENGTSEALLLNTFTRDGYDFTGWNTQANGGGTNYADGATFVAPASQSNTSITLYAQWEEKVKSMQNYTLAKCQAEASSAPVTLVDTRDDNTYTVRYINGNCWMTQNLRLAPGKTIYNTDSNISASSYTVPTNVSFPANYNTGSVACSSNINYGCHYNYLAATAGTIAGNSNTTEAVYDICPKGWKIPSRTQIESIGAWSGGSGGTSTYVSAFAPIASGWSNSNGTFLSTGSLSNWWSSTPYAQVSGGTARYRLEYHNQNSLNTYYGYRQYGWSVRCVIK